MRYELTDYEWTAIIAERAARRAASGRPADSQRHLLGLEIRRTVA